MVTNLPFLTCLRNIIQYLCWLQNFIFSKSVQYDAENVEFKFSLLRRHLKRAETLFQRIEKQAVILTWDEALYSKAQIVK